MVRFLSLLALSLLSCLSCQVIEEEIEYLGEVCAREAQVVTTFEEGNDELRLCSPERCTLREAIVTANACGSREVVQLSAGTYRLTSRDQPPSGAPRSQSERDDERVGPVGLPRITGDVVIRGARATIERAPTAPTFRIFHVTDGGRLTLEDVTVANGDAGNWRGGGVLNEGDLVLTDATLRNHSAGNGGAVYNAGTTTVSRSTLQENVSQGQGGAVFNGGTLRVRDGSLLRDNRAQASRAGSVAGGGAIFNDESGTVDLQGSELVDNRAASTGGAVHSLGTITVAAVSLSGNEALHGAAVQIGGGDATVEKSTVHGNTARGDGGAFNVIAGNLQVRSSTISGNGSALGGGIAWQSSGSGQLVDVTIARNTATAAASGGGLNVGGTGSFETRNTIVAGNSPMNCASTAAFRASGQNLASDDSCAGFTRRGDPLLGPLQDNGGPTHTHALGAGGPAIDNGADCLPEDQRGLRRPVGRCDIGAFEVQR